MKTPIFSGCCTAIVTPFSDGKINYERMGELIDFQYENGVSALVVCGTTGENATMTQYEHEEMIDFACKYNNGRMKIIAGIGSNCTEKALKFAQCAKHFGADGTLMVTPYYNKTSQAGLIEHFTYVADRVDIPMILYNVPSRTGIGITAATYKALSEHPNINGVKEASGDFTLIAATREACGDELNIWSGNDDNTLPMMSMGAKGVISVASNIVPSVISKLCALCLEEKFNAAEELLRTYTPLFSALFIETNPMPVKYAMKALTLDSGEMRLPLTEISESSKEKLIHALIASGLKIKQ